MSEIEKIIARLRLIDEPIVAEYINQLYQEGKLQKDVDGKDITDSGEVIGKLFWWHAHQIPNIVWSNIHYKYSTKYNKIKLTTKLGNII